MLPEFLNQSATEAARRLLGCYLVRELPGAELCAKIVETESYDSADAASHSFNGKTQRNAVMFGSSGHLYVYFTYGMHYCCNIVTSTEGDGSAVLIRAVQPVKGEKQMRQLRDKNGVELTNGPAKLCQALGIDGRLNGHDLTLPPLRLLSGDPVPERDVACTTRVGISRGRQDMRRFYIKTNPYVSVL